jgi:hypothetical protein
VPRVRRATSVPSSRARCGNSAGSARQCQGRRAAPRLAGSSGPPAPLHGRECKPQRCVAQRWRASSRTPMIPRGADKVAKSALARELRRVGGGRVHPRGGLLRLCASLLCDGGVGTLVKECAPSSSRVPTVVGKRKTIMAIDSIIIGKPTARHHRRHR